MHKRFTRWAVTVGFAGLLAGWAVTLGGGISSANVGPANSEGEVSTDLLKLPGPDGGPSTNPGTGGQTDGFRQGADPNDFSISSRRPQVQVTEVARPDLRESLRQMFQVWYSRIYGALRRS